MIILRARPEDTDLFTPRELDHGACCFYTEDRTARYRFCISDREAVLDGDSAFEQEAIDAFLFYSGFVSRVCAADGRLLRVREAATLEWHDILDIKPSQFFISRPKLAACRSWIASAGDVCIPVAEIDGALVAQDGHTRLRAALRWALAGFGSTASRGRNTLSISPGRPPPGAWVPWPIWRS